MNHVLIYDYIVLHGDGLETNAQAASHDWSPDTSVLSLSRADEECGGFTNVSGWTRELIGAGLNDPPPAATPVPGFNPGDNVRVNEAVPSPLLPRVGDLVRWRTGGRIMTLANVSGGDTRCEWERRRRQGGPRLRGDQRARARWRHRRERRANHAAACP